MESRFHSLTTQLLDTTLNPPQPHDLPTNHQLQLHQDSNSNNNEQDLFHLFPLLRFHFLESDCFSEQLNPIRIQKCSRTRKKKHHSQEAGQSRRQRRQGRRKEQAEDITTNLRHWNLITERPPLETCEHRCTHSASHAQLLHA